MTKMYSSSYMNQVITPKPCLNISVALNKMLINVDCNTLTLMYLSYYDICLL